jgi:hypothetical protein
MIHTATQPVAVGAGDEVTVTVAGDLDGDRRGSEHAVGTPAAARTGRLAGAQFPVPAVYALPTAPGDAPAVDALTLDAHLRK